MTSPASYTVVGVCADGSKTTLACHVTREAAEQVLSRILPNSGYSELRLQIEGEWPPPIERSPRRGQRLAAKQARPQVTI